MTEAVIHFIRRHFTKIAISVMVIIGAGVLIQGIFDVGARYYPLVEGMVALALLYALSRWVYDPEEGAEPKKRSQVKWKGKRH